MAESMKALSKCNGQELRVGLVVTEMMLSAIVSCMGSLRLVVEERKAHALRPSNEMHSHSSYTLFGDTHLSHVMETS